MADELRREEMDCLESMLFEDDSETPLRDLFFFLSYELSKSSPRLRGDTDPSLILGPELGIGVPVLLPPFMLTSPLFSPSAATTKSFQLPVPDSIHHILQLT